MTTKLTSTLNGSDRSLHISASNPSWISVQVREPDDAMRNIAVDVDRAEFLAAVATELDVIAIPRADLPKVTDEGDRITTPSASWPKVTAHKVGADGFRRDALENLALAEYLDAHPPVDQAQVSSLADAMYEANVEARRSDLTDATDYTNLARRLLATGRVTVKGADK